MKTVTLQDIADEAGICKATVSFILNGNHKKKRISDKTCARVRDIAQRLGYQFDDIARAMSTEKANVIGFIAESEITYEFVSAVLAGAMQKADEKNLFIKLLNYYYGITSDEIVSACKRQRLSGLLCYNFEYGMIERLHQQLSPLAIPLAVISNSAPPDGCIHVMANDYQGGRLAVKHLLGLGHERAAFISDHYGRPYSRDREKGYLDTLLEHHLIPDENLILRDDDRNRKLEFLNRICVMRNAPTAVFCKSDADAIAVISYFQRIGKKIPEDFSVVGYGDLSTGRTMSPSVTTVWEPYAEIGAIAVEMICSTLKGMPFANKKVVLDVKFLARESSGPAK